MKRIEEENYFSKKAGWIAIIVLSFTILSWGMVIMMSVKETERKWDYGSIIAPPAASVYTSERIDSTASKKMKTILSSDSTLKNYLDSTK